MTGKKHAAYLLYFKYGDSFSKLATHIEYARKNGTALEIGLSLSKACLK